MKERAIDPSDDFFGTVLNCAVRYACGRQSYMPKLVVDFITPLIPKLSSKTLWCFDQDLTEAEFEVGYGNPTIDKPLWIEFHRKVRAERKRRGAELYESWRKGDAKPVVRNKDLIRRMEDDRLAEKIMLFAELCWETDNHDIDPTLLYCDEKCGDENGEFHCDDESRKACAIRWLNSPAESEEGLI